MKTLYLSRKELSVLRLALCQRSINLQIDELKNRRVGLSTAKIRKQIVFNDSLLSKL
nr:MAG: hypothetical protein [Microvirus sp.]